VFIGEVSTLFALPLAFIVVVSQKLKNKVIKTRLRPYNALLHLNFFLIFPDINRDQ